MRPAPVGMKWASGSTSYAFEEETMAESPTRQYVPEVPLSACGCGPGCSCGCQSGGSCQCGGGCG
ncbi:hypothetical protein DEJ47_17510 [Streptomyces venezuelae]|uniref:Metallothionein n=1 Tax=Streptomyces venezuelae TaxID=54571 RepID=A0A5P2BDF4_STRVZ|nr:hypothetical protein DEJ47_17510 [Streptomyces venezuelae]